MPADQPDEPAIPPECRQWMEQTIECAERGDIAGCLAAQERANACLRRQGQHALDMPEEYFVLMHQSITAAQRGDMAEARRIADRMEQLFALTDFPGIPSMPAECKELLRASNLAEDRGDARENIRLTREYNSCLRRHGLSEGTAPDEFFDLQLQALDAEERGDRAEYQRLMGEIVILMQLHGLAGGLGGEPEAEA